MRAAVLHSVGSPESVEVLDVDKPEPGYSQIRIKVQAATPDPVDMGNWLGVFPAPPEGVSATDNVMALLDVLEHGFEAAGVKAAPPSAVEMARRAARGGVGISDLLRGIGSGRPAFFRR